MSTEFLPRRNFNNAPASQSHGTDIDTDIFELVVLAKNARIHSNDKLVLVLAELEKHPWDIVLFSETRASSGKVVLHGGHVLYSNIGINNAYAGVAILLHAKHVRKSTCVHMISGRVIAVDVVSRVKNTDRA